MSESMKTAATEAVVTNRDATKDAGRVRFGAGMIYFADAPTARESIKDAGRVRLGAGMMRF